MGFYDLIFGQNAYMHQLANGTTVVLRPGDKVRVESVRYKKEFDDGIIEAVFRGGVRVRYGFGEYFAFYSTSRSNTKYDPSDRINDVLTVINPTIATGIASDASSE